MDKSADAFRTIAEAAEELQLPQHVLRFWETRFPQIKPLKRGGGRRYYRPRDLEALRVIKHLLYAEGYTIKGVQRVLKEQGIAAAQRNPPSDERREPPPLTLSENADFPPGSAWQDDGAGLTEPLPQREEPPFSPLPGLAADSQAAAGVSPILLAGGLDVTNITRLRAALDELVQCEAILEAARLR